VALSQTELQQFQANGFVVRRKLCASGVIAQLDREIEGIHEAMHAHTPPTVHVSWEVDGTPDDPPRIRQLMNSEMVCPTIDAISRDAELLSIMRQLIGPNVMLYHSKLMLKAARNGSYTPWHQDWGYWHVSSREPTQINCMLAIDPMDQDNGCIRYSPGSHRAGLIPHSDFKTDSFNIGIPGNLEAFENVPVELDPGDAVFFGPLVLHCSAPNQSGRDRRANTFAFDRTRNQLGRELPVSRLRLGTVEPEESPSIGA
jgi:ectoine hydroxylase-related dioxygenase (phytanoyl-CoA dioxygenase family)